MNGEPGRAEPSRYQEMFGLQKVVSPRESVTESPKSATCSGTNEFPTALSFLSIGRDGGGYPDTGESGEAYDLEASLEFKRRRLQASSQQSD